LQTQRGGKQGFDGNTHQGTLDSKKGLSDMVPEVNFHWKRHRALITSKLRGAVPRNFVIIVSLDR